MDCIGVGGIGLVYEAFDRELGTRVAIKTLQRLSGDALLRFKREFRLLQGLEHRNLVQLGELFEEDGTWFFSMELLHGKDFMSHVTRRQWTRGIRTGFSPDATVTCDTVLLCGTEKSNSVSSPVPPSAHTVDEARLRDGLYQIAEGLGALHRAGMVHRDIKPRNVIVSEGRVVLVDFGLVDEERSRRSGGLDRGRVIGTPSYMAPEQAAGRAATPASDWYAVGAMLYEALIGIRPFEGNVEHVLSEKQCRDPLPPSQVNDSVAVPEDLEALCMQLLHRDPADRPGGDEVLARLAPTGSDTPSPAFKHRSRAAWKLDFIGRQAELQALGDAVEACRPGHPMVAFVHGRSGMGKSALIDQFLRDAQVRAGIPALFGRCYECESIPYKALDGVVDDLYGYLTAPPGVTRFSDRGREATTAGDLSVLARLFPVLETIIGKPAEKARDTSSSPPHSPVSPGQGIRDPAELRCRAFAAFKALLCQLAQPGPVIIAIDDMQWGDMDSVALLSELISPPDAPALLLVVSYRSEESEHPLITSLRSTAAQTLAASRFVEVEVGRLPDPECRALIEAMWKGVAPSGDRHDEPAFDLVSEVVRECAGSPFFVGELMHYLASLPVGNSDDRQLRDITLDRVVAARYRQLDRAGRALLEVIAVAGRPVEQRLAVRAAGFEASLRPAGFSIIATLRSRHLVRTLGSGPSDAIEPYHDRIRHAVLAQLAASGEHALRDCYRRLADAVEAEGGADNAEMLADLYYGSGQLDRAADHAIRAARNAESALAFDRAARMYRLALATETASSELECSLTIRLGDALANAGLGVEAATEYLAAAAQASGSSARKGAGQIDLSLELKRRAAEHLLRSGRLDQGFDLLAEILAAVGLDMPSTHRRALASLLRNRARLRVRGLGYRPRETDAIAVHERQRADICWSAAIGLSLFDIARGADYATRHLLLALRQGDDDRIARALLVEACHLAAQGSKKLDRATRLIEAAVDKIEDSPNNSPRNPTEASDAARLEGMIMFSRATVDLHSGHWRRACGLLERAETIVREQCTGAWWELGTVVTHQAIALYHIGEWGTLRRRIGPAIRQAMERSDLYTAAGLACYEVYGHLAADDVGSARHVILRARQQWNPSSYHLQNYLHFTAQVSIDLYRNDPRSAWQRCVEEFPVQRRSLLTRVEILSVARSFFYARSALALAACSRNRRKALVGKAVRAAQRVGRRKLPWTAGQLLLVQAGAAACTGDRESAAHHLREAAEKLREADLLLFAESARWQWGRLTGGNSGREAVQRAERAMRDVGVVNPQAIADMLAPGFSTAES
ncbi:MAG: protein kinase [Proteobacteria bacterium]|nr:protein kinase [Pseudomonadota bacterium]